jgi:YebC/PmpR family DNA-binding regulatory protein
VSGHSHWSGIKHKKAVIDNRRGKLFSKLSKAIMIAARESGGDPDMNLKLRYAIDKAKSLSMPRDNIERVIKRATGEAGGEDYVEILYEGYGPGGVAIIAEALTDKRTRTTPEVRKIFENRGGSLAKSGAVAYQFEKKGLIGIGREVAEEDAVIEMALEAGAEDVEVQEDIYAITCGVKEFDAVRRVFAEKEFELKISEIAWVATATVAPGEKDAEKVRAIIDDLENHDDVQSVASNLEDSE